LVISSPKGFEHPTGPEGLDVASALVISPAPRGARESVGGRVLLRFAFPKEGVGFTEVATSIESGGVCVLSSVDVLRGGCLSPPPQGRPSGKRLLPVLIDDGRAVLSGRSLQASSLAEASERAHLPKRPSVAIEPKPSGGCPGDRSLQAVSTGDASERCLLAEASRWCPLACLRASFRDRSRGTVPLGGVSARRPLAEASGRCPSTVSPSAASRPKPPGVAHRR
jgi:hypothetical protein